MQSIDTTVFLWLNAAATAPAWTIKLAQLASLELPGLLTAGAIGALLVADAGTRRQILQVLLAMTLAVLLAKLGQHLFPIPRPFTLGLGRQWLEHGRTAGFPSTHASAAFAFAASIAMSTKRAWIGAVAFLIASLIGWSRLYLGLHFPSDVLAGALTGGVCAYASGWILRHGARLQTVH